MTVLQAKRFDGTFTARALVPNDEAEAWADTMLESPSIKYVVVVKLY